MDHLVERRIREAQERGEFEKLPGFGKELSPDKITISCSKDGFKQTRAFTRTPLNKKPLTAIEIECTMQRIATK